MPSHERSALLIAKKRGSGPKPLAKLPPARKPVATVKRAAVVGRRLGELDRVEAYEMFCDWLGRIAAAVVERGPDDRPAPMVVGEDPFRTEHLWARMYRGSFRLGRRGAPRQLFETVAPFMPAGKMTGTSKCEWFPGGFHVVCRDNGKGFDPAAAASSRHPRRSSAGRAPIAG